MGNTLKFLSFTIIAAVTYSATEAAQVDNPPYLELIQRGRIDTDSTTPVLQSEIRTVLAHHAEDQLAHLQMQQETVREQTALLAEGTTRMSQNFAKEAEAMQPLIMEEQILLAKFESMKKTHEGLCAQVKRLLESIPSYISDLKEEFDRLLPSEELSKSRWEIEREWAQITERDYRFSCTYAETLTRMVAELDHKSVETESSQKLKSSLTELLQYEKLRTCINAVNSLDSKSIPDFPTLRELNKHLPKNYSIVTVFKSMYLKLTYPIVNEIAKDINSVLLDLQSIAERQKD